MSRSNMSSHWRLIKTSRRPDLVLWSMNHKPSENHSADLQQGRTPFFIDWVKRHSPSNCWWNLRLMVNHKPKLHQRWQKAEVNKSLLGSMIMSENKEVIIKLINESWRKECVHLKTPSCQPCDTFKIQQFQASAPQWQEGLLTSRLWKWNVVIYFRDVWFDFFFQIPSEKINGENYLQTNATEKVGGRYKMLGNVQIFANVKYVILQVIFHVVYLLFQGFSNAQLSVFQVSAFFHFIAMLLKEESYVHQGSMYLIKNTVKKYYTLK